MRENIILSIFFLFIPMINSIQSNSYYLIDIDQQVSSNESYCSNIFTIEQTYRIPKQCHQHLLCTPYFCDDKSFRCMKIRETLCCLYSYIQSNCQQDNSNRIKDIFRSVYFQISIEHGYCEINLERIEKNDQAYCLANLEETTMTTTMTTTTTTTTATISSSIRPFLKYFHRRPSSIRPSRYRHRLATRQNHSSLANLDYLRRITVIEQNNSSRSSHKFIDYLLIISFLLFAMLN